MGMKIDMQQRGFTLVELMISMVISLLILAALVSVFVNTSSSNREMERTNALLGLRARWR